MRKFSSLLFLFLFTLLLAQVVAAQDDSASIVRFIHIGDPQFGYELDSKAENLERMQKITSAVKLEAPEFVIIPGDFVEGGLFEETLAYKKSVEAIESPMVLVPGNHDVRNRRELNKYRKKYGQDYGVYQFKSLTVIALNSEVMRDQRISAEEFTLQWQWFEAAIEAYQSDSRANKALIITTHRPPFSNQIDEPQSNVNWPPQTRERLLSLAKKAGVKAIIAGHTHTTREIVVPDSDLTIYTVGGTARVFDDRGSGYRLFTVSTDALKQQYVQTGTPAKASVGFMGFSQWTPRLFNFSIRHWFWTLVFFATGLWMLICSRHYRSLGAPQWVKNTFVPRSLKRALLFCGFWYVFFAINMQLDFDELLTELARRLMPENIHRIRHDISLIVVGALGMCLVGAVFWWCRGKQWVRSLSLMLLAIPSVIWFLLQVMSNTKYIPNNIIWAESVWDKIFFASLVLSLLLLFIKRNHPVKSPAKRL